MSDASATLAEWAQGVRWARRVRRVARRSVVVAVAVLVVGVADFAPVVAQQVPGEPNSELIAGVSYAPRPPQRTRPSHVSAAATREAPRERRC